MRRAVAIVLLLLLLDRSAGFVLGRLYERTFSGEGGGRLNYAIAQQVDLLILGSSRAKHHIDPRILQRALGLRAYNAGVNGYDFLYAALLMELRKQAGVPAPRAILLHVDPSSFAKKASELERLAVLSHFVASNAAVRDLVFMRSPFEWLKYQSWAYRYNGKVLPIALNLGRKAADPAGGFVALSGELSAGTELEPRPGNELAAEFWPVKLELFSRLVASCRASGTKIYVVNTPTAEDLRQDHERWFRKLQATLPDAEHVVFMDLSQYTHPEFQDRGLFRDGSHLNGRGARLLTEVLSRELLQSEASSAQRLPTAAQSGP